MPTTRRSIGSAKTRSAPTKGQSTLSFSNKVTKNVPSHTKSNIIAADDTKVKAIKQEIPAVDEVKEVTVEEESEEEDSELVEESETEFQEEEVIDEKSELELKAEKLSDAQITKYWKTLEKARSAPRVHQKDLSVSEKVLRYFDVCSQYGPCVGTSRTERWHRAERLGLNPPVEVLAVLLKEENSKGDKETAYMDQILNSITVSS